MNLFNEIIKNRFLRFIDVSTPDQEFNLEDLNLFSFVGGEKQLVFMYLNNSIESISCFFSVLKSQHVLVLLSLDLSEKFKIELEQLYSPAFIFDKKRSAIDGYSHKKYLFERIKKNKQNIHQSLKVLLSTSGTTGSPKFVKISEWNLLSNATSIAEYLSIDSNDITPLNLPIYYSYGLSVLISNSLRGGKIFCGNIDVLNKDFWVNMEKAGYTSIAGVPFVYEMLDRIGFTKKKYPSLRYLTQAGGKLQNHLVKKFANYADREGIDFFVMYGQTEASARMSYLPPIKLQEKIGSIGIPIPGGRFFINPENQELCYEGPNIFGGYVTKVDDLASFEQNNVLYTGDLASQDVDGFFYIIGRLKRFVKLFGNRVNLDELESLLAKKFDCVFRCVSDNDKKIFIVSDEFEENELEIKNYLTEELKIHPSVLAIKKINEIPLTANGKVNYNDLLLRYGS